MLGNEITAIKLSAVAYRHGPGPFRVALNQRAGDSRQATSSKRVTPALRKLC